MKVVIVGCTHAGTAAAKQILASSPNTEVTVYERHQDISFLSCGISLYLSGKVKSLEEMFYATPEDLEQLGAKVRTNCDVYAIDTKHKTLRVEELQTGIKYQDTYDKLVMATGSVPVVPPIEGVSLPGILMCKDYEDAKQIYQTAKSAKRIAIIGGGYVGVELVEAYSRTGHDVMLINGLHRPLSHYVDVPFAKEVEADMKQHGVQLYLNEVAHTFDSDDQHIYIKTNKAEREADLAVVCVGFRPQTDLLEGQVELTKDGAIHVNDYMQTSDPDIFAAGDSVAVHFNPTQTDAYTPLATNAVRQGALVGRNIFKPTLKYLGTQATSALHLYGKTVASTGLTLERAQKHGFTAAAVDLTDNYRPEFMESTTPVEMRLVYDQNDHRILGGQLVSKYDIAQSANLLSVCIQNKNTIEDLAFVDMLFSPYDDRPFNYLNLLGQAAMQQEEAR
ncbi:FAD-dependent oxidoreductase [Loigolactobacillus backii]|nr:FAD-dependent oxidoreductase [Loigolactobacillus backii]MDA5386791.1 FAD-dependent oxidoreductase [Loigolactobacillus backii]MDA5389316.1 FAD-dependent oxidoreductase [Loigolactobacillus backii]PIO82503.1 NADH oxidase [Loigolactobacillus backii]PIO86867.1 NADH oxidase [Loigolactobacillus backii]